MHHGHPGRMQLQFGPAVAWGHPKSPLASINLCNTCSILKWVCLKMGYTPNYSHLVGIMIINHWVIGYTIFRQTQMLGWRHWDIQISPDDVVTNSNICVPHVEVLTPQIFPKQIPLRWSWLGAARRWDTPMTFGCWDSRWTSPEFLWLQQEETPKFPKIMTTNPVKTSLQPVLGIIWF